MNTLKEQVVQMISTVEDEYLLELVKADIEYFSNKNVDIIDDLYYTDKEELLDMANEPNEKDTMSEDEFKEATKKWRIK